MKSRVNLIKIGKILNAHTRTESKKTIRIRDVVEWKKEKKIEIGQKDPKPTFGDVYVI